MIRLIEEISMNAWPAAQTLLYDGWVLRFTNGYTRRANSINPLYASHLDIHEKIRACERLYREKGLPVIFKMTAAGDPGGLDDILAGRGYQEDALTSVQVLDLSGWDAQSATSADLSPHETEEWQTAFCRMSEIQKNSQAVHQQILQAILPTVCYAAISVEGQNERPSKEEHGSTIRPNNLVGCGLGVLQEGYIGLFDIVVDVDQRRQGHGERLVRDLLTWGKRNGACHAYLQVMLNNPPAVRLYEKLGFREEYRYWYRVSK